jgi:FKBP-type peptidyl-prolyl cis-trans isomerase (trigger factor)
VAVGGAIYIKGARGKFVEFWAKGVPYPAGLVKWKVITYSDYLQDLDALEHFYSRQQEAAGLPAPEEKVLEKAVMDRMVRNIAVAKIARERGVWVKQDELKAEFQSTVSQVGTTEEAELLLKDLYGWNSRTFMDRVLKYFVLEEKLLSEFGGSAELEGAIAAEIAKLSAIRFFGK